MTETGSSAAQATATAVLPTPVGPTRTGTSGRSAPPKSPLQLVLGQLHDRGPPVHVVRGKRCREQPAHEVAHLCELEALSRLDRCPTGERRPESLEPVREGPEPAARKVRHELLEAARGVEARMRVRRRMHYYGPPGERLDLVSHAPQQLPVGVDRVELGRRELERERQEQPLTL